MTKRNRIEWVDIAKGIGIILVVLGHVFAAYARQNPTSNVLNEIWFKSIYTFHMPLFFFISGLFVNSWLKRSFRLALKQKIQRLVIPYLFWGIVSLIFLEVYSGKIDLYRFLELIYRPVFVLWFVYSLFIIYLLFYLMKNLLKLNNVSVGIIVIGTFVISIIINSHVPYTDDSFLKVLNGILYGGLYFAVGYFLHDYLLSKPVLIKHLSLFFFLVLIVFSLLNIYIKEPEFFLYKAVISFAFATLGIVMVLLLSILMLRNRNLKHFFSYIGEKTMPIYLMHKIIVEFLSVLTYKFIGNIYLFGIIVFTLSMVICLVATKIIQQFKFSNYILG